MVEVKKTIAIIDDDEVFRRGLVRAFKQEDYVVFDYRSGESMFVEVESSKPDIILCDYKLPGSDGLEILEELRRKGDTTPFVLMTAHYTEEILERATDCGAIETFEKPLNLIKLKNSCLKALRN